MDFATAASQKGVCINQQMCLIIIYFIHNRQKMKVINNLMFLVHF
jgi:hypothetical protein